MRELLALLEGRYRIDIVPRVCACSATRPVMTNQPIRPKSSTNTFFAMPRVPEPLGFSGTLQLELPRECGSRSTRMV